MNEKNKKNVSITEEYLDKKLGENNQVLLSALDSILEKQTKEIREELYIVRNELKEEIQENKSELKRDINNVQTLIDAYVKNQEDFRQEFTIIKEEMKQVKKILKEKFDLEISAI